MQSLTAEQATRGAFAFCVVMKLPTKLGVFQNHAAADMAGGKLELPDGRSASSKDDACWQKEQRHGPYLPNLRFPKLRLPYLT